MNKPKTICRILWLCILVSLTASVNAQLNRHQWLLGGALSGSYFQSQSQETGYEINTPINIGYFVLPKWAIGIRGIFGYEETTTNLLSFSSTRRFTEKERMIVGGFFTRYYLLPRANKFNLYAEIAYAYGRTSNQFAQLNRNSEVIYDSHLINVNLAPVYFINNHVGVEFLLSYGQQYSINNYGSNSFFATSNDDRLVTNTFLFGIGLQVHLNQPEE
ncbi:MAG: hypothetical protein MUE96_02795 [Bacteroidia bacterium]|jgi:hypothetical protein|nr:hypothetical protein [Bacteroidia bacterium]